MATQIGTTWNGTTGRLSFKVGLSGPSAMQWQFLGNMSEAPSKGEEAFAVNVEIGCGPHLGAAATKFNLM